MTEFFILISHLQENAYYKTYICISESNKSYLVMTNVKNISSKDITYYLNDFIYSKSDGYYGYDSNHVWIRLDRTYG